MNVPNRLSVFLASEPACRHGARPTPSPQGCRVPRHRFAAAAL